MTMSDLIDLAAIRDAADAVRGVVHRTPMAASSYLSAQSGYRVTLKLELFQKTGSFKVRGVVNTLRQLTAAQQRAGVVSLSAGNHAQALAWGAARLGFCATIVMPSSALPSKVAATRAYGGEVIQTAGDLLATALELQAARDLTLIHPFDDTRVIAGQATVGLEVVEDVPDVDLVLVACGGGGLLAGVAAAVKLLRPQAQVIGIEPEGAAAMAQSLKAGTPQRLASLNTIADGLAAPFAGARPLAHVQAFVDKLLVIPDTDIIRGTRALMERCKLMAEPAAGAAVAPLLTGSLTVPAGARVVAIVCGGNVDLDQMKSWL